jgi:SAM-dependent methyltransferase
MTRAASTLPPSAQAAPADVLYAGALRGDAVAVVGLHDDPQPLPVRHWRAEAARSDRRMLAHCHGPTVDLGCGPGRMAAHLASRGIPVLGVDRHPEAVAQARSRGVPVVRRDLFAPLPGEGSWACALLADGNVGIGGDPHRLLRRVRGLLARGGTAVVDLAPPGVGVRRHQVHLRGAGRVSRPFPWAVVGADALPTLATATGFAVAGLHEYDGRWVGVLRRTETEEPCPV